MKKVKENLEEVASVTYFQDKLDLTKKRLNKLLSHPKIPTPSTDPSELDIKLSIRDLPIQVKNHFITAGIIRGEIFNRSGAFACISTDDEQPQEESTRRKPQILDIKGPHYESLVLAVGVVERLMDEVVRPETNPTPAKKPKLLKNQPKMCQLDYEIKEFPIAVISTVIVKGIIQGKLYQVSGAVVTARGSPHLSNPPLNERLLYLHIQAQDHQSVLSAIQEIDRLINEVDSEKCLLTGQLLGSDSETAEILSKQLTTESGASASGNMQSASSEQQPITSEPVENSLSDVIQQLQQYIEGNEETPEESVGKSNPAVTNHPAVVDEQPAPVLDNTQTSQCETEDTPLTDIIQQLQQYIDSSGTDPA